MAVTKTVMGAMPYELDGKVVSWTLEMKYEDGEDDTYFTSTFHDSIESTGIKGEEVFEEKAKGEWTRAEIIALIPTDLWDRAFAKQYSTLITNPTVVPVADNDFELPES